MKELEDHSWFPPFLRNFQTEFIGFVVARFHVYEGFVQHLKTLNLPLQPMTDLCSGSGEPAISIFRKSGCFSQLFLSDKYPNALPFKDGNTVHTILQSDVLEMEFQSGTCYTMFNAFHHFTDEDKIKIVQKMQFSGSRAFLVEVLEPTPFCLLKVFVTGTLGSLLLTPLIFPFSLRRLFFTYVFPVNILTITFDGVVSVYKSRSVKHYQKLFTGLGETIKTFRLSNGLFSLIVIHCEPQK
ncbi:MAG TPA: hypothetical protein DIW47_01770 [Bacteroidetes bacterium]|nr:hypothetical protein [Bacteroidota bacterium]